MLHTGLEHITSEQEFNEALADNKNVMICCGRMGPMCLPVFDLMEAIGPDYPHVAFRDMFFDAPVSQVIRSLPEIVGFAGLPFTVYFRDGKVVQATSSIQSLEQVTGILDEKFGTKG